MLLTEYNETETMELFRQEGLEEGMEKGIEKERITGIRNIMDKLHYSSDKAMDFMNIPREDWPRYKLLLNESSSVPSYE